MKAILRGKMVKVRGEKGILNRVHSSCLMAICVFIFFVTGCAGMKTSPENIVETGEKQEETEESEKPENAAEESVADDDEDALAIKQAQYEGEKSSSFCLLTAQRRGIEWAIYSEETYCYSNGSFWGYLSKDGEEIAPCIYEEPRLFPRDLPV